MPTRLTAADHAALTSLQEQANTIRLDGVSLGDAMLSGLRTLLGADTMVMYRSVRAGDAWGLEAFHLHGQLDRARFRSLFEAMLGGTGVTYGLFDPLHPEPGQRNKALILTRDLPVSNEQFCSLPLYQKMYKHLGLHGGMEMRVLVCDRGLLLTWLGGWHREGFSDRERSLLQALVPVVKRRLAVERILARNAFLEASLTTALDALDGDAFLVDDRGRIQHASVKAAKDCHRAAAILRASGFPRRAKMVDGFTVLPVRAQGLPDHHLVLRQRADGEIDARIEKAARVWRLTPRQRLVLSWVVRGECNKGVAERLSCSVRAVEQHLTQIFRRAGVDSRSATIARVFSDSP